MLGSIALGFLWFNDWISLHVDIWWVLRLLLDLSFQSKTASVLCFNMNASCIFDLALHFQINFLPPLFFCCFSVEPHHKTTDMWRDKLVILSQAWNSRFVSSSLDKEGARTNQIWCPIKLLVVLKRQSEIRACDTSSSFQERHTPLATLCIVRVQKQIIKPKKCHKHQFVTSKQGQSFVVTRKRKQLLWSLTLKR